MDTRKLLADVQRFVDQYVYFPEPGTSLVVALWIIATHAHLSFDAFPYLSVTAATKRAGKTRLLEVLEKVTANAHFRTGATATGFYKVIGKEAPTILVDEAERMSEDSLGILREILNSGYRRGGVVTRPSGNGMEDFPVYGPKAFTAIGDLNDTLRDRSIVVTLARVPHGHTLRRFLYEEASAEGHDLRDRIATWYTENKLAVRAAYAATPDVDFLTDRDAEIWLPLFVVQGLLDPTKRERLERIATDLAGLKTAPATRYADLAGAEAAAEETEYAERLLRDLLAAMGRGSHLHTAEAVRALQGLPTAPWRVFRGTGLTDRDLANLLARFPGVKPVLIRSGKRVARGYRKADVQRAVAKL